MGEVIMSLLIQDLEALSSNVMYGSGVSSSGKQFRYLVDDVREYKEMIQWLIAQYFNQHKNNELPKFETEEDLLKLTIEYGVEIWSKKNKKIVKHDASNVVKPIEDAIASFIGRDDRYNFKVVSRKLDYKRIGAKSPFVLVYLERTTLEEIENESLVKNLGLFNV